MRGEGRRRVEGGLRGREDREVGGLREREGREIKGVQCFLNEDTITIYKVKGE